MALLKFCLLHKRRLMTETTVAVLCYRCIPDDCKNWKKKLMICFQTFMLGFSNDNSLFMPKFNFRNKFSILFNPYKNMQLLHLNSLCYWFIPCKMLEGHFSVPLDIIVVLLPDIKQSSLQNQGHQFSIL